MTSVFVVDNKNVAPHQVKAKEMHMYVHMKE